MCDMGLPGRAPVSKCAARQAPPSNPSSLPRGGDSGFGGVTREGPRL